MILANSEDFIPEVVKCGKNTDKNLQIAASTVLMNIAVLLKSTDNFERKSQLLSALLTIAEHVIDDEANFRLCTALGTLLWKDEDTKATAHSLDLSSVIQKWNKSTGLGKLKECATFVGQMSC